MTLARKLRLQLTLLTLVLAGAATAVVWGVQGARQLASIGNEEFEELRMVRRAHLDLDQATVHIGRREFGAACGQLSEALERIGEFFTFQAGEQSMLGSAHGDLETEYIESAVAYIHRTQSSLEAMATENPPIAGDLESTVTHVGLAMAELETLASQLDEIIGTVQGQTIHELRIMAWSLAGMFAAILAGAVTFNILHYKSIIGPLRYVREGARRLALGELDVRLNREAAEEFAELQSDFNIMAGELEALYGDLEHRVEEKSRELTVSERRASLGYLAAGVAHEINNPLGIISGHAESLLRRLGDRPVPEALWEEIVRSLQIIKEEAFRGKHITQELLSLSRMGDEHRAAVSMKQVVDNVVQLVQSTPVCQHRVIRVSISPRDPLTVMGSGPELTQVVLNLAINAVESVGSVNGHVELAGGRRHDWIELRIVDNGCGMTRETIDKAFEPFFTTRGNGHGCGLGLSISHAIIERHGGTITAESEGPGQGSCFTLQLPAHRGAHP